MPEFTPDDWKHIDDHVKRMIDVVGKFDAESDRAAVIVGAAFLAS